MNDDLLVAYTVRAMVDTIPVNLLFDSGFNGNITILKALANDLGIEGTDVGTAESAGATGSVETTRLRQFTIGAMHFGEQSASIGRFPFARGAVGAVFLSMHHAIFDYAHDMLYLQVRPDTSVPLGAVKRAGDIVIPLTKVVKNHRAAYLVNVVVNSTPMVLLLDTGAGVAGVDLDDDLTQTLGLQDPGTVRMTMGAFQLAAVPFSTMNLRRIHEKEEREGFPKIDGLLGAGVLKDHGAIVDFDHAMLYMRGR